MAQQNTTTTASSSTNENDTSSDEESITASPTGIELLADNTTDDDDQSPQLHSPPPHVLTRMPNTAFGIAMGLAGNAIMWKSIGISTIFNPEGTDTSVLNAILWLLALCVAVSVGICYCYKCIFHFDLVQQEFVHPVRIHFLNTPHLILIMLALGLPDRFGASQTTLQVVFGIGLVAQTLNTQHIYENWLFNPGSSISCAKPPFLLSTVGWFLSANLGLAANIPDSWGLALPQFCVGIGVMFYLMVAFAIMNSLHRNRKLKGSPALTLMLAPPSVGVIAIDVIFGEPTTFSNGAAMVLGWILVLFLLFAKIGPQITRDPGVLGEYWAYVFPLAAVATAWVRYASIVDTTGASTVAVIFIVVATLALVVVTCRTCLHMLSCVQQKAQWGDPLLGISSSIRQAAPTQGNQATRRQDNVV